MNFNEYSYGVTKQFEILDEVDEKVLELKINGYTTVNSEMTQEKINQLKQLLDECYERQAVEVGGHQALLNWGDANILRAAMSYESAFLDVAINQNLLRLVTRFMGKEFVLIMQNGLINRPGHGNEQGKFHRDLNYQHWTSSSPIAMNALLCLDDFTLENGATWVTPGSHHLPELPSKAFLDNYSVQVTAKAGTFLVLDGMLFHKAGTNKTSTERRALNHVIGLPFMSQVVDLPLAMKLNGIDIPKDPKLQRYLGAQWRTFTSAKDWRLSKFKQVLN